VKESPGGLRDYHTALWVGATRFGARTLEQLHTVGVITPEEQRTVAQAYDFLLRVRTDLHFSHQRKSDVLAIEVQRDTARRLGYVRNGPALAVERFMRDYYLQAREMYHFCASALHRCRPQRRGIGKVFEYMSRKDLGHGFVVSREELDVKEGGTDPFRGRPTLLLEVFLQCQQLGVRPSEDLKARMRASLALLDESAHALYLLLAEEPGEDPNELVYDVVNKIVKVTGTVVERDGLRGIVVTAVEPVEAAPPVEP